MASETLSNLSTFEIGLLLSETITLSLGILIAIIAYRGYRRNASRPMLYLALGFVLVIAIPGTLSGIHLVTGVFDRRLLSAVVQLSEIAGMLSILQAIRIAR